MPVNAEAKVELICATRVASDCLGGGHDGFIAAAFRGGGESALGRKRGETLWDTGYDGPLGDDDDDVDIDNDLSSNENKNENDRGDNNDDRDRNVGNIGEVEAGGRGERDSPRF